MRELRLTSDAARDVDDILASSEDRFGLRIAEAYRGLLVTAFQDLLRDPSRPGVASRAGMLPGILLYHLRHSRSRAAEGRVRIARPRHVMAFRVTPTAIEVLRILHDAMDLPMHLGDED